MDGWIESGRKKERQMKSGADLKSKGQVKKEEKNEKRGQEAGRERQSELCQMDKCQRELHRPSELSSPSQNAMCKSRCRGPRPASPRTVMRLQTSTTLCVCV